VAWYASKVILPGAACGLRQGHRWSTEPSGSGLPCGADLLQGSLHHLQRRIDGSIRGGATLGDLEQLASDLDLHACDFLTFLSQKDNLCFENVFVWRVEFYESLRNPAHQMWRQPSVSAFNV